MQITKAPVPAGSRGMSVGGRGGSIPLTMTQGEMVVHPTHGVGEIKSVAEYVVAGERLEMVEVFFHEGRLTLKVPMGKVATSGLRGLASRAIVDAALEVLAQKPKAPRGVWARRALELQNKLRSGDPRVVAEVVRDLSRNLLNPERSFSERQLFDAGVERLAVEVAAALGLGKAEAVKEIHDRVSKTAAAAAAAEAGAAAPARAFASRKEAFLSFSAEMAAE